ncbi:MAG: hypothetical protein IEMM0008_1845 [bacterium]|nr:MAG: hypothetical protein IEMM0008_1845 [bacterium]
MRKKILVLLVFISLSLHSHLGYGLFNVEITGAYAGGPNGTTSNRTAGTLGAGFGLAFDIDYLTNSIMLQLRVDASYFNFNRYKGDPQEMYPIFFGGRLLFGNDSIPDWLVPYVEAGVDFRIKRGFDAENGLDGGLAAGLGAEFYIHKNKLYLGLNFRYHLLKKDFWTISPSVGYRF